jgi:hypothetical protein
MNTNPFIEALDHIPENYRFAAFLIIFLGGLAYLFVGDYRRNKTLAKVVEGNRKIIENLSDQYNLTMDLVRRYSDNLSNEQVPPFVMLVYKNLQIRLLKIHVGVKKDYDTNDIAYETAKERIYIEGRNLFKLTIQVIHPFKFKGVKISKAFCPNDFELMIEECITQLGRRGSGFIANRNIESIVDSLTVKTTDRLQNEEESINS